MTPQNVTDDLAAAYVKLKTDHAQLRAHAARLEARVLGAEQAVAQVMRGAKLDVGTTNTLIGRLWEALREEGPPPTETDTLRADLEALRAKAGAVGALRWPVTSESPHYHTLAALRAELDKPSGASLLAERDAWKALAMARASHMQEFDDDFADTREALAALRALGIDPEAT